MCWLSLNHSFSRCVIPIPLPSAQHTESNAMHAAVPTTLQHSASREDGNSLADRLCTELITLNRESTASIMDAAPPTIPTGTTTRTQTIALPIVLPIALLIVHCPGNLTNTIAAPYPTGTPRIVLMSSLLIALRQVPSQKVPSSSYLLMMGPGRWP